MRLCAWLHKERTWLLQGGGTIQARGLENELGLSISHDLSFPKECILSFADIRSASLCPGKNEAKAFFDLELGKGKAREAYKYRLCNQSQEPTQDSPLHGHMILNRLLKLSKSHFSSSVKWG